MLHLHVKTCPAGASSLLELDCPTGYRGCDQGRKLLAHYRRCRSIRARQAGLRNGGGGGIGGVCGLTLPAGLGGGLDQQHCLICSLVARQARSVMEKKVRLSPTGTGGGSGGASSGGGMSSPTKRMLSSSSAKYGGGIGGNAPHGAISSFVVDSNIGEDFLVGSTNSNVNSNDGLPEQPQQQHQQLKEGGACDDEAEEEKTLPSAKKMPPPPPRSTTEPPPQSSTPFSLPLQPSVHPADSKMAPSEAGTAAAAAVEASASHHQDVFRSSVSPDEDMEDVQSDALSSSPPGLPTVVQQRTRAYTISQTELEASATATLASLVARPRSSSVGEPVGGCKHVAAASPRHRRHACDTIVEENASLGSKESHAS